ncbi:MAG: 4-hydroxy-tetrahydrodipicolinate reductase [Buchnera aphidicola (Kaburagia rhusicola rhusicola)]
MQHKPFRIAISGALGKMGVSLIKEICNGNYTNISLSSVIVKPGNVLIKQDIGSVIGIKKTGIFISDSLEKEINNFDILIDFTNPKNTMKNLNLCSMNNKNIVIGTTGLSDVDIKKIKLSSKNIGIILSPNYSIGINLILNLLRTTTKVLGKYSDIEIIEAHHRAKKDAPSGTAIEMGKTISNEMNWNLQKNAVYFRKGLTGQRKNNEIGFSTIRAGDIVGDHTVIFANPGERIEITHKATNRLTFSRGAIKAAIWLMLQNKTGLFNMSNVLNI